jgi:uncharacterized membrane protein
MAQVSHAALHAPEAVVITGASAGRRQGRSRGGADEGEPPMRDNPRSTAQIAGHPLHPMIIPFPIAFFVSAFVTDLVFLSNGDRNWAMASYWLLGAGLVTAALAALLGLTDFLGDRRIRALRPAWLHMIGNVIAVLLEAVNFYLRWSQGREEAMSTGVVLSGVVVVLLLFNGWMGWELVYRGRVGVHDAPDDLTT